MTEALVKYKAVNFYGDELIAVQMDGATYTPLKRICETLGVSYSAAYERVMRDEVLASVVREIRITADDGKGYMMACIPDEFVNGFLFGFTTSQVKPHLRDRLILYKRECYRALHRAFNSPSSPTPPQDALADQVAALAAQVAAQAADLAQLKAQRSAREQKLPALRGLGRTRAGAPKERRRVCLGAELLAVRLAEIPQGETLTQAQMALLMKVQPRTIARWLQELKDAGIVTVKHRGRRVYYITKQNKS